MGISYLFAQTRISQDSLWFNGANIHNTKNSIRDACTPQPGIFVLGETGDSSHDRKSKLRKGTIEIKLKQRNCL